ncbi:PREDICTED: zinc finger and SCAN domain-containing protein 2-like isoform X3 [Cyprinodon variegatus]|uniref:zinc finger and SCAN domain-containing protein 2-like isoform X3 n=1 Tax=Cyprinodon variegatus TaxID=28743 RepID=UPI000742B34D|nr:PREDICTED: zinc finger and SCAN domain-containing protein 2-like isoform X3 [Cyprinodon variegatus]
MNASSLRLLLPPLRLLTAAMWQVVQQQSVKHYGMLEELVSLVTEAAPELLSERKRALLLLALRTKVILADADNHPNHLQRIRSISTASDEDLTECCSSLLALTNRLAQTPAASQRLLQEVFNQSFDSALQSLVSDFLSRVEQLFPVPDFREAASWLQDAPGILEESLQETEKEHLRELLSNQSCRLGRGTTAVEETILSAWSHPLLSEPAHSEPASQSDSGPQQLEEAVIGQSVSEEEQESSNGLAAAAEVGNRMEDSPGDPDSQSAGSKPTAITPCIISHNAKRVANRCPECGKCFIYRSQVSVCPHVLRSNQEAFDPEAAPQVISHLRSNKACGSGRRPGSEGSDAAGPHPSRINSCFQCSVVFQSRAELLAHMRSHQHRPVFKCNQCDKAFLHLSSLTNHKQTHLSGQDQTCSGPEPTSSERDNSQQEQQEQQQQQEQKPDLTCSICHQNFSSHRRLLVHLQTHASQGVEVLYKCPTCDQSFTGVTLLRIHMRSHKVLSYPCPQCNKAMSTASSLQSHLARHTSDPCFLCQQCGKRLRSRGSLELHLRIHSGERPYRCPHCPKSFSVLPNLKVHVRRHTGERPYVCKVCGKAWPSGGDLEKHMRFHTGEKRFVCQECGKAFTMSCNLKEHLHKHRGEKPFSCPECGKGFWRKFEQNRHVLTHRKDRPYACTFCSKSYTRRNHLNRHLLTHQGPAGQEKEAEEAN